ncbi:hypothetical protein BG015_000942 [Linnemannia schmuckeri]|uniref:Secreted protein n=1 Tax=Linnemannia schmuckeri TaxID=64567 RepID=A0A9P5V789_9FUNG|nr:hypothetical protein BG015_000942 [Linnemannia schmuckeri]
MNRVIVIALAVLAYASHVYASDDDFCIYFYKEPHYQEQAGFICGSLGEGEHVGRPSTNMPVVASLTAPDWMQVTLYEKKAYKGTPNIFQGDQDAIAPVLNVQSFKLYHTRATKTE